MEGHLYGGYRSYILLKQCYSRKEEEDPELISVKITDLVTKRDIFTILSVSDGITTISARS
jgi:hypothetical protein